MRHHEFSNWFWNVMLFVWSISCCLLSYVEFLLHNFPVKVMDSTRKDSLAATSALTPSLYSRGPQTSELPLSASVQERYFPIFRLFYALLESYNRIPCTCPFPHSPFPFLHIFCLIDSSSSVSVDCWFLFWSLKLFSLFVSPGHFATWRPWGFCGNSRNVPNVRFSHCMPLWMPLWFVAFVKQWLR